MIALRITVPALHEETAVTVLWELGTAGVEVLPASQGAVALLAFFPVNEAARAALVTRIRRQMPGAMVESADVPDVDWLARFRDGFRPFDVGGFRIVPVWENGVEGNARILRIDPGRAFGTGTHESTRLCLLLLERLARQGRLGRVLDVGAGTGILAIAAMRLGAAFCAASDLDAEALNSCRQHATLNATRLRLLRANGGRGLLPGRCDVLLANLTASLLIERAQELGALFTRFGVLAGLLAEEVDPVRAAFAFVDPTPTVERMGEWAGLLLARGQP